MLTVSEQFSFFFSFIFLHFGIIYFTGLRLQVFALYLFFLLNLSRRFLFSLIFTIALFLFISFYVYVTQNRARNTHTKKNTLQEDTIISR